MIIKTSTATRTNTSDTATSTIDFQKSYEYPTSYQVQYNDYNYCPHRLPCGYCRLLMQYCPNNNNIQVTW